MQALRTRLRAARWAVPALVLGAVAAVTAGVVLVVVTRDGDPAAVPVDRDGVASFPARGPLVGDTALLRRAARAWQDRDTVEPPAPSPASIGERRSVLWAGRRGDRTLVLLARHTARQRLRLGYYVEDTAGHGVLTRQEDRAEAGDPIALDATGWLVPQRADGRPFRVARREFTAVAVDTRRPVDGVLDLAGPAVAVAEDRGVDGYLIREAGGVRVLDPYEDGRQRLLDALAEPAAAERLLDATLAAVGDDAARATALEVFWRGAVPGVGSDALVVRGHSAGTQSFGIAFGGGARLGFAGDRTAATPTQPPVNCGPQPKCAQPRRPALPVLLAGWLYRGQGNPRVLVVIASPDVVRVHVRAGTVTRDLPGGAAGLTIADLGLPGVPGDASGEASPPSVLVHGETAAGDLVPAVTAG